MYSWRSARINWTSPFLGMSEERGSLKLTNALCRFSASDSNSVVGEHTRFRRPSRPPANGSEAKVFDTGRLPIVLNQ